MPARKVTVPSEVIREGGKVTIYTIGYEKRTGKELMALLKKAGIEHLADIRKKPISRKADFRAKALQALCERAGIEYGPWPDLGATEEMRERLQTTGDLVRFHKDFRAYAKKSLKTPVKRLAEVAAEKVVALLCYERAHEECHRSTIADLVADELDGRIVAIL